MNSERMYSRSEFCNSCLCYEAGDSPYTLQMYSFHTKSMNLLLSQNNMVTLCQYCKRLAQQVERFIENIENVNKLFDKFNTVTASVLQNARKDCKPCMRFCSTKFETKEFGYESHPDETAKGNFLVYNDYGWKFLNIETKQEIKEELFDIEEHEIHFLPNDKVVKDYQEVIKQEIEETNKEIYPIQTDSCTKRVKSNEETMYGKRICLSIEECMLKKTNKSDGSCQLDNEVAREEKLSQDCHQNDCDTDDDITTSPNPKTDVNIIPEKSKKQYERCYQKFKDWKTKTGTESFTEGVLLRYFEELSIKLKPSSLCADYSMLKATLKINDQIDISNYSKLQAFLKDKSEGFTKKTSRTFRPDEIKKFIDEAPDHQYLVYKIALIFGVLGACRRHELYGIKFNDVKDVETAIFVTISSKKTKTPRFFSVTGKYYEICKQYMRLRPTSKAKGGFFLQYMNGKCTAQNIGINSFGNMAKTIASYLNLPEPDMYTGHCFRRTSEALFIRPSYTLRSSTAGDTPCEDLGTPSSRYTQHRVVPVGLVDANGDIMARTEEQTS